VQAEPVVKAEPVVQVKQKRVYKKKTPEEKAKKAEKAIKSGKPVKLDILLPTPSVQAEEVHHDPKFIETTAPPITISEFVTVKVKKTSIQGKSYYYDSNSGKLYTASVNGVGAYKGRYNIEEGTIDTTFPDSDLEA
jgi:hypothetical protein